MADTATPTPTFCRLEYLGPEGWNVGHKGLNLLYPEKYPQRLAANGKVGRVIIVDTGEIIDSPLAPPPCDMCGEEHSGLSGSCLI